jgi:hypothetical protein
MRQILFICLAFTPLGTAHAQEDDSGDVRHSVLRDLKLAIYRLAARNDNSQANEDDGTALDQSTPVDEFAPTAPKPVTTMPAGAPKARLGPMRVAVGQVVRAAAPAGATPATTTKAKAGVVQTQAPAAEASAAGAGPA